MFQHDAATPSNGVFAVWTCTRSKLGNLPYVLNVLRFFIYFFKFFNCNMNVDYSTHHFNWPFVKRTTSVSFVYTALELLPGTGFLKYKPIEGAFMRNPLPGGGPLSNEQPFGGES